MKLLASRTIFRVAMAAAAFALLCTVGAGLAFYLEHGTRGIAVLVVLGAGAVVALGALWIGAEALDDHFRDMDRLRGLAIALRDHAGSVAPPAFGDRESVSLAEALLALADSARTRAATPDARLMAVLGSVGEAIVAITANGQVSLVNGRARLLLGEERVAVGTSVFAALRREPVIAAIDRAHQVGGAVPAHLETVDGDEFPAMVTALPEIGGVMIGIAAPAAAFPDAGGVHHDLSLHGVAPTVPVPRDDTPLADLPITVVDTETTGLDPVRDRVVAIGAVRMHGSSIYPASALDCLVRPDVPIPARATAVHGIGDDTVRDQPGFGAQGRRLAALAAGTVVVGHNIGFDLAVLRTEAARTGVAWEDPAALCVLQLSAALEPGETRFDLEEVAARNGVPVMGRHTALGDCLVTAELWRRLLPRLAERGVTTLGDARALAASAARVIARQRAAGW